MGRSDGWGGTAADTPGAVRGRAPAARVVVWHICTCYCRLCMDTACVKATLSAVAREAEDGGRATH